MDTVSLPIMYLTIPVANESVVDLLQRAHGGCTVPPHTATATMVTYGVTPLHSDQHRRIIAVLERTPYPWHVGKRKSG